MRAVLYSDGAARGNPGPAAAGAVVFDDKGEVLAEISQALGQTTNNVAEYRALIAGLEKGHELGVTDIDVRLDSELIVRQIEGRYRVKNAGLIPLYRKATDLLTGFRSYSIKHVPREENKHADRLANQALDSGR